MHAVWTAPGVGRWPEKVMNELAPLSEKEKALQVDAIVQKYKAERAVWLLDDCSEPGCFKLIGHLLEVIPLSEFENFLSNCADRRGQKLFEDYKIFFRSLTRQRNFTVNPYKEFVDSILKKGKYLEE